MKSRGTIVWALLGALFLAGAAVQNVPLRQSRKIHGITQAEPLENAPPLVAFTTVALGGFRGILADILWMRASELQEEGRYFELVQLADWITKLQPRYAQVWAFHGWNLAYNVSVLFNSPEDRWRWVRHGFSLLRDEGLVYNPGDANLLWQLGWIFQHKIGQEFDDAHRFYKESWAREMMALFDGPAPDYAALASAPATREALLARPGTAELVRKLAAAGIDPYGVELLGTNLPPAAQKILNEDVAAADLRLYVRRHAMVETYKLDPALMQEVDEAYGPLDWRVAQSHAIYWGWRSRRVASGFDIVSADRMIFQSLAESYRTGRLFLSPTLGTFMPSPNLELMPRVRKSYEEALAAHPDQDTIKTAHENFLREAIELSYTFQRTKQAQELLSDLHARYPKDENSGGLEQFVLAKLEGDMAGKLSDATPAEAHRLVESHFYQACIWRLLGDTDRAAGFESRAKLYYVSYMATRQDRDVKERTGLAPIADIQSTALDRAKADFAAMKGAGTGT